MEHLNCVGASLLSHNELLKLGYIKYSMTAIRIWYKGVTSLESFKGFQVHTLYKRAVLGGFWWFVGFHIA